MKVSLTLTLVASVYTSLATAYTVTLPYITVTPDPDLRNSSGTPLAKPLLAYYSIPYVAPPTGENRFRPPQDPVVPDQRYSNLTNYGPVCPQPLNPAFPVQAEDCLTLSVFRPRDVDSSKKLPVVVWVPGGAFNTGGGRGLNVPSLVGNAPQDMVAVSINYRIGALGGIPSSAGKAAGAVNLGLLDQAAAFKWVQQYISRFGGDPKQVTLFGESAGAHSVGAHLQHTWPKNERPFDKVIMDSGGPAARAWPDYTYPLYEQQSQEFFNMTGCNRGGNATWDCLRTADLGTIVNASTTLYAKYSSPVRWPFQPVVDYAYVNQAPSVSWSKGQFERVPILTGFNTDEGTVFVPRSVQNATQFRQYFQTLLIANDTILNEIEQLYPDPATNPGSPYQNSSFSPQWSRLAAAYGDYAYISTVRGSALAIAGARDKKAPVWKYHFNRITTTVPDNKPLGVAHASELVSLVQVDKSETSTKMTAYYTSFIVSGDPNALTPKNYTSWPKYTIEDQKQIAFNQDSVVVQKDDLRTEQQDFWLSNPQIFPH